MKHLTATYRPIFRYGLSRIGGLLVLLVLLFGTTRQALASQLVLQLYNDNNEEIRYNWVLDSKDSLHLSDEDFYSHSGKVLFRINKYGLPKNDKTLEELENIVLPRINQDSLELVAIVIRGAASPEGPYWLNKTLSERRAKALTDFVTSRLKFSALNDSTNVNRNLRQDCVVEDYRLLCIAMKNAGDPDYGFVKGLCDKYLPADQVEQLKKELMKARQGQLWKRLYREYFPELRAARIMLFFRKHEEPKPEPVVEPQPQIAQPAEQPKTAAVFVQPQEPVCREEVLERRKLLAIKTNLLLYGAYIPGYNRWAPIPNVAIEYYPQKGHLTWGASFDMPWYQDYWAHKYFQFRNYQVEGRYYLKGAHKPTGANEANEINEANRKYNRKAYTGFYLQAYAHAAIFGICFDENRGWVGEGAGAGLGFGYVVPLSRKGHWRLELGVQAGFFRCKYDPYQYENPVNPAYRDHLYYYKWTKRPRLFQKRQYRWNWIGPTRIGVTLTYDLLYRRIQKRGVSLKSTETRIIGTSEPRNFETSK